MARSDGTGPRGAMRYRSSHARLYGVKTRYAAPAVSRLRRTENDVIEVRVRRDAVRAKRVRDGGVAFDCLRLVVFVVKDGLGVDAAHELR